jgi:phosphotransferase system, enzyme I, PtsP
MREIDRERRWAIRCPKRSRSARCWRPPASPSRRDRFFEAADFISIGGNDLKQFFFAADRENELVRRRYDTLNAQLS